MEAFSRAAGGENALIGYGIFIKYLPLFSTGTASCPRLSVIIQSSLSHDSSIFTHSIFILHQHKVEFVNEDLKSRVKGYHPLKNHLLGFLHQQEVG